MSSAAIKDLVEMVEALPSEVQKQVMEHLREYIKAAGKAKAMDFDTHCSKG
jgi:hypothetical protein